jgi:uncharacterized protein (DUF1778 family)
MALQKDVRITIRIEEDERVFLQDIAESQGCSMS